MFLAGNVPENRNLERHVIFNNIKHFQREQKEYSDKNTCWIWFLQEEVILPQDCNIKYYPSFIPLVITVLLLSIYFF